jgi:hypothetical protein
MAYNRHVEAVILTGRVSSGAIFALEISINDMKQREEICPRKTG